MKNELSKVEVIKRRKEIRRKARLRRRMTLGAVITTLITIGAIYSTKASATNYVPEVDYTFNKVESFETRTRFAKEILTGNANSVSQEVLRYDESMFYGKVVSIGTDSFDGNTIVQFICMDKKKSNNIYVSFSGTVDLVEGEVVAVLGDYRGAVADRGTTFTGVENKNIENSVYLKGTSIKEI